MLFCYSNYQGEGITFNHNDKTTYTSSNLMDKWIVSFTQSLLAFVHQEMDRMLLNYSDNCSPPPPPKGYRLYSIVSWLVHFIDQCIDERYVQFNRRSIKVHLAFTVVPVCYQVGPVYPLCGREKRVRRNVSNHYTHCMKCCSPCAE